MTLIDKSRLSIKAEDGQVVVPRITSNNKIQLRFATKDYVGEYFHYTGDLMLIYTSGLLVAAQLLGCVTGRPARPRPPLRLVANDLVGRTRSG